MKIRISKEEMLKKMSIAMRAVAVSPTNEILQNILIEANEQIRFYTNNAEIAIATVVDGTVDAPGALAVDAKMLDSIVRKLPDEEIIIRDETGGAIITCAKIRLMLPSAESYDALYPPEVEASDGLVMTQYALKQCITQTFFASDNHSFKKIFYSVHFKTDTVRNIMTVTSTDQYVVALRRVELAENQPELEMLVPVKTLSELLRIMSGRPEDNITISATTTHAVFRLDDTILVTRANEEPYIDVSQYMSEQYTTKAKADRKELLGMLDRATLLLRENDKKPIIMDLFSETIQIGVSSDIGEMQEDAGADIEGESLKIGFNPKRLMNVFKVLDDDDVTMYMTKKNEACYIRDDAGSYVYMVLPVTF